MSKILVLVNHYNTLRIFRRELLVRLSELGHEVVVSMPPADDANTRQIESYGCRIHTTKMDRRGINPFSDLLLLVRYIRLIKAENPDKVILYTIKPNIYGSIACRLLKKEHYANVTGLGSAFFHGGLMMRIVTTLYRFSLKKATRVFFENEGNRDTLVGLKAVRRDQTVVMPGAGVNTEEFPFCAYPSEQEPVHFLFIGRIMKEKGVDELFEAIRRLRKEGSTAQFDFIGWYEDDYQEVVESMQRDGLLIYHGFQQDVRPYIEKAHCVILPSYHEGMSNTLLESASMGRPLITTDIPGCREAILEGQNGFLVPQKDCNSLVDAIRRYCALSHAQRKVFGISSRLHVECCFEKQMVVERTLNCIFNSNV